MTLTEMLSETVPYFPGSERSIEIHDEVVANTKDTFKGWLKAVRLPSYDGAGKGGAMFNTTESLRQLLIALVDEP